MNIKYEQLDPTTDLDEVLAGLCENFAKYEPMGKALALDRHDLTCIFKPILADSAATSFVARDTTNNKIAGAIVCNHFNFFLNNAADGFNGKGQAIEQLLNNLEKSFIKSSYFQADKTYYQYATFVNNDYGNQGIATGLYKISEKYALENGYKNVFTISTGPISQHIRINKLGFVIVDQTDYKLFEFSGRHVFAQIDNVDTCKCLVKIF